MNTTVTSLEVQSLNRSNHEFASYWHTLLSGDLPAARKSLGTIKFAYTGHLVEDTRSNTSHAAKMKYCEAILDTIAAWCTRSRRDINNFMFRELALSILRLYDNFMKKWGDEADQQISGNEPGKSAEIIQLAVTPAASKSGNFGKSESGKFGKSPTPESGKFGESQKWEILDDDTLAEPVKDLELQELDAHPQEVASLGDISTPLTSPIPNPSNTPISSPITSHSNNIISLPTKPIQKSSRRVLASVSGSLKITPTRAQRASASSFDRSQPAHTRKRSRDTQMRVDKLRNPFRRSWKHLNADSHFLVACLFGAKQQHDAGNVHSFRLTFSGKRTVALLKSSNPGSEAAKWIRLGLEKAFDTDIPFGFKFEISDQGQFHLHGFVIIPEDNPHKQPNKLIGGILRVASGEASKTSNASSENFYDGIGYFAYLQKAEKRTSQLIKGRKLTYLSDSLRNAAKQYHAQMYQDRKQPTSGHRIAFSTILQLAA